MIDDMLTNEEFRKKLNDNPHGIITDTFYKGNDTVMDCICSKGHKYQTKAFALIYSKSGCPVCGKSRVVKGCNDLWTINKTLASMLYYPEDGYKITNNSVKKVFWRCPDCGAKIFKSVSNVFNKGLKCNSCYDGISFPNRYVYNFLSQLKINFKCEYIIEGATYRYDFYIPSRSLVIEVQGKQHYYGWNQAHIDVEEIQKNDLLKKEYALNNNISEYIEIDAREGKKSYMERSIKNSELAKIWNLSSIDWDECYLKSMKSYVKVVSKMYNDGLSTQQISQELGFAATTILEWLKKGDSLGFCKYVRNNGFLKDKKSIILLNTMQCYDSLSQAAREYDLSQQNLSAHLNKKRNYCGKDSNGNPMIWKFQSDYNGESYSDCLQKIKYRKQSPVLQYSLDGQFIKKYVSAQDIKNQLGYSDSNIRAVCNHKKKTAYGFIWKYEDDYLPGDR